VPTSRTKLSIRRPVARGCALFHGLGANQLVIHARSEITARDIRAAAREPRTSCSPTLCLALCSLLLSPTASPALTLERAVEPPPPLYASGPSLTGKTSEMILPNVEQVDLLCRLWLRGLPQGSSPGTYYQGCYDEKRNIVVLVDPKSWPSRREWRQIRQHEWAHARGWRHLQNGHGTDWARSRSPPGSARVLLAAADPAS
jgi:hypothetical protein